MLIRSQDKLQLVTLENGTVAVDYRSKSQILFYEIGSVEPSSTIGKYSSEEKAIKVLDNIQNEYQYIEECKTVGVGRISPEFVFQMPQ